LAFSRWMVWVWPEMVGMRLMNMSLSVRCQSEQPCWQLCCDCAREHTSIH
jgi:hypothetical protein